MTALRRLLARPSSRVAAVTAANQLAPVAMLPLSTLLYDVSEIASFQIVFSASIVAQTLVTLGVEYRIPSVVERSTVRRLILISICSATIFLLLGIAVAAWAWCTGLPLAGIAMWSLLLTSGLAIFATFSSIRVRDQNHTAIVLANLLCMAIVVSGQVVLAWSPLGLAGLIGPMVLGRLFGTLFLLNWRGSVGKRDANSAATSETIGGSESIFWVASLLLSTLALQLPIIAAGFLVDERSLAVVALALRIVSAPASLLGAGLAQGFIFESSRTLLSRPQDFSHFVSRSQRKLSILSALAGLCLSVGGPVAVLLLFKAEWHLSAWMVLVLAVPFSLQMVNRVLTPVFTMIRSSGSLLAIQVARNLAMGIGLWLVHVSDSGAWGIIVSVAIVSLGFQITFALVLKSKVSSWSSRSL